MTAGQLDGGSFSTEACSSEMAPTWLKSQLVCNYLVYIFFISFTWETHYCISEVYTYFISLIHNHNLNENEVINLARLILASQIIAIFQYSHAIMPIIYSRISSKMTLSSLVFGLPAFFLPIFPLLLKIDFLTQYILVTVYPPSIPPSSFLISFPLNPLSFCFSLENNKILKLM